MSRSRYRKDVREFWAGENGAPLHRFDEGNGHRFVASCGAEVRVQATSLQVRGHWPEGACRDCVGVMRATTTRLTLRDARREKSDLSAALDDLLGLN